MQLELTPVMTLPDIDRVSEPARESRISKALRGRVLIVAGLGNIGSPLALHLGRLLGPLGVRLRLFDRDVVESKNFVNQAYGGAADIGRPKVEVIAEAIRRADPEADCDPRHVDLEDTSIDDFADAELCLGGLDSLRARQCLITERAWPLGIPVIDGGVGEPSLGRVQVFVTSSACPECSWSANHYRQLAREYPCEPGGRAAGPPTNVPAFVGATVAAVMASECWKWLSGRQASDSYEVSFDLESLRFSTGRLHRAAGCRFDHQVRSPAHERSHAT